MKHGDNKSGRADAAGKEPSRRGAATPAAGSAGQGAKSLSSERVQHAATAVKRTVDKGKGKQTKDVEPMVQKSASSAGKELSGEGGKAAACARKGKRASESTHAASTLKKKEKEVCIICMEVSPGQNQMRAVVLYMKNDVNVWSDSAGAQQDKD